MIGFRVRRAKWVYGNPWAFKDPKVVKNGYGDTRQSPHWEWEKGMPALGDGPSAEPPPPPPPQPKKRSAKRKKKNKVGVVHYGSAWEVHASSGDSSAKSLAGGKLSPLPPRKGIIKTRGTRTAADGELSDSERGGGDAFRPTTVVRKLLAKSSYRPLPATKRATTAGAEVMEIHHDKYEPGARSSDSTVSLGNAGNDTHQETISREKTS